MFEALAGCVPFSAPNVARLLLRIVRDDAPRVRDFRDVPAHVDTLVAQLLARDPAQRMPNARALSRALLPYADQREQGERDVLALLRESRPVDGTSTTVECTTLGELLRKDQVA
ncbi:MAG: hypothetical protein RL701_1329, partial [Pseudomonadota bacterium]